MTDRESPVVKRARTEGNVVPTRDAPGPGDEFTGQSIQQLMKQYYSQIFPTDEVFKWLAYGNDGKHPQADSQFFQRRELCFTLDGDIFVRYQSFKNGETLQKGLVKDVPAKIDIGPVYTVDPRRRKAYTATDQSAGANCAFVPVERELVFDIDLTDYDDVRACGKEGHICRRRGIHCWVCDEKARQLTDDQRSALANYLSIYKGTENGLAKLMIPSTGICHPSVGRALEIIRTAWIEKLLPEQGLLETKERWQALLKFFGEDEIALKLDTLWSSQTQNFTDDVNHIRWENLEQEVAKVAKQKDVRRTQNLQRGVKDIILAYAYPRLDVEVSKKMNHLLKAPFCIHPKTGKVCLPIQPEEVWDFDPEAVPTVQQLLREAKAARCSGAESSLTGPKKWDQTAMAPCMRFFQVHFLQPLLAAAQRQFNEKARHSATKPTLAW